MKNKLRSIFAAVLFLMIIAAAAAVSANPSATSADGNFDYVLQDDGTVWITLYRSIADEVIIPSTIDGYPVSAIKHFGSGAKKVVIEDGIEAIHSGAFSSSYLTSIVIPDSVTEIGDEAFYQCSSLTELSLPNHLQSIGTHAFKGCSGLTDIVIPYTVSEIGTGAFEKCTGLKTMTFNGSHTEVDRLLGSSDNIDVTIYCYGNSSAERYAKNTGVKYIGMSPSVGDFTDYLGEVTRADENVSLNGRRIDAFRFGDRILIDLTCIFFNEYGLNAGLDVEYNRLLVSDEGYKIDDLGNYTYIAAEPEFKLYGNRESHIDDGKYYINGKGIDVYGVGQRPAVFLDDLCGTETSMNQGFGFSDYLFKAEYDGNNINIYSFGNDIRAIETDDVSISRIRYYLFDNVIQPVFDFTYKAQSAAENWVGYDPVISASDNQILPLYILIDGEYILIGMCSLTDGFDGKKRMIYNFYDTGYVKQLLADYKKSVYVPSHDELVSYFCDESLFIVESMAEDENYTAISVAPVGSTKSSDYALYVISKNNGGYRQIYAENRAVNLYVRNGNVEVAHIFASGGSSGISWLDRYKISDLFEK